MPHLPDDLHDLERALLVAIGDIVEIGEEGSDVVDSAPHVDLPPNFLSDLFAAQVQSRLLDHTARWLRGRGYGYYTIGSAGHESNAAVAAALRVTDPALLHYRSGGFYCRARPAAAGS